METSRKYTYTYRITATHGTSDLGCAGEVGAPQVATYAHVIVDRITEFTQKYNIPVFGCKEHIGTPNEHYHFYLDTETDEKKLRDNLHNKYPEWKARKTDKKLKALKRYDYDPPTAYRYLCKGDKHDVPPCIVINTVGLTEEQILEYQRRYWETAKTSKKISKTKTSTKNSLSFKNWFIANQLETFRLPGTATYSLHNPEKVSAACRAYYNDQNDWYMEINIQRSMHLVYNTICREYDIPTYERYAHFIDKKISQTGFDYM